MALGRQHPVFSPLGCMGGATFAIGVAIAVVVSGGAIFSPGALTAYASQPTRIQEFGTHADFENDCFQCHEPLQGISASRCESCHVNVAEQRVNKIGVHGNMPSTQAGDCASCHRDHRGRDFNPTVTALKKFDHTSTGFSLTWHFTDYDQSAMKCRACHADATYAVDQAICLDCHNAHDSAFMLTHAQAFGRDCLTCHDGVDKMHDFDHAQTSFALEGKHAAAECVACHDSAIPAKYTPLECAVCHAEPPIHAGRFSTACAECHTPTSWKPARLDDLAEFDHADTAFQLINHARGYDDSPITCNSCHVADDFSANTQPCADCHTNHDPDFMTQHIADFGLNCVSCHDGAGNMTSFDHDAVFALDGAHATADCAACHQSQQFKGTPSECSACHAEPEIHVGIFGLNCAACHTAAAWAPAQLVQHRFPLDHGGQGEIPCATCHTDSYVAYTCYGCHEHDRALVESQHVDVELIDHPLNDCVACHEAGHKQEGSS